MNKKIKVKKLTLNKEGIPESVPPTSNGQETIFEFDSGLHYDSTTLVPSKKMWSYRTLIVSNVAKTKH